MEAAVRTAHYLLTGQEMAKLEIQPLRGLKGAKEIRAKIGDLEVGAAVVSGLGNARKLLDEIRAGRKDLALHRGHDLPRRVHQRRRPADRRRCQCRARADAGVIQN